MSIIVEENVLGEDAVVFDEEFQQNYVPKVQSFSKGIHYYSQNVVVFDLCAKK